MSKFPGGSIRSDTALMRLVAFDYNLCPVEFSRCDTFPVAGRVRVLRFSKPKNACSVKFKVDVTQIWYPYGYEFPPQD